MSSTDKLSLIVSRYVGKDDPTVIVRCQGNFPAVGEVIEPFHHALDRRRLDARLPTAR